MHTQTKERNTKTKAAVSQVLQSFAAPVALNDLHEFIKMSLPKTAFSTIFRIIQKLDQEGKVIKIEWGERGSRYEWAELPHHHHLVCQRCGMVADIDDGLLNYDDTKVRETTKYLVSHHSIELQGVCPPCQAKGTS